MMSPNERYGIILFIAFALLGLLCLTVQEVSNLRGIMYLVYLAGAGVGIVGMLYTACKMRGS